MFLKWISSVMFISQKCEELKPFSWNPNALLDLEFVRNIWNEPNDGFLVLFFMFQWPKG
jgi:hypothetical protein